MVKSIKKQTQLQSDWSDRSHPEKSREAEEQMTVTALGQMF